MSLIFLLSLLHHFSVMDSDTFDIQGHRGCRGLLPENSLPAFIRAAELGVSTLELDVVVSKDGKLVVSHEPWLNPAICLDPAGKNISPENKNFNLYSMEYSSIRNCDCGSKKPAEFPQQKSVNTFKPLLSEVFDSIKFKFPEIQFNIEIKSRASGDHIYHPAPEEFAGRLLHEIKEAGIENRVCIQSFDSRAIRACHLLNPEMKVSFLSSENFTPEKLQDTLGFLPQIFSPHYKTIDEAAVTEFHRAGIKVIPWTVNDCSVMESLYKSGVDGLITDYPDRALYWWTEKKKGR
jgi:glycerophosphoryl diester phosphodiesterase